MEARVVGEARQSVVVVGSRLAGGCLRRSASALGLGGGGDRGVRSRGRKPCHPSGGRLGVRRETPSRVSWWPAHGDGGRNGSAASQTLSVGDRVRWAGRRPRTLAHAVVPRQGMAASLAFKTELDSGHRAWLGESVDGAEVEARAAAALLASVSGDPAGGVVDAGCEPAGRSVGVGRRPDGRWVFRLVDGVASGLTIRSRTRAGRVESRSGRLYVGTAAGPDGGCRLSWPRQASRGWRVAVTGARRSSGWETCGWFGTAEPAVHPDASSPLTTNLVRSGGRCSATWIPSRAPRGRALVGVALTGAADRAALRAAGAGVVGPGRLMGVGRHLAGLDMAA